MTDAISPRQLAHRIYRAFRHGDIADLEQLKDSLLFANFQDSGEHRNFLARVLCGLSPGALGKLPNELVRIDVADHCQGNATECAERILYWAEVPDWEMELPDSLGASWHRNPMRAHLISKATDRLKEKRRAILWLSDLAASELSSLGALNLMADLGRLGLQASRRRRVVVFSMRVMAGNMRIYKPTMADSGFAFFWRAWPDSLDYGMTRSLRDNRAVYREWIVPKADVEIVDAWPLPIADVSLSETELDAAFWQACRDEVRDKRTQFGL